MEPLFGEVWDNLTGVHDVVWIQRRLNQPYNY